MEIDELSRFTGIRAAVLTGWLNAAKPVRSKKKPSPPAPSTHDPGHETAAAITAATG